MVRRKKRPGPATTVIKRVAKRTSASHRRSDSGASNQLVRERSSFGNNVVLEVPVRITIGGKGRVDVRIYNRL